MFVTSNYEQMEATHDVLKWGLRVELPRTQYKNALQYKWPLACLSKIYTFVV